jgi:D-serine dehydratase
MFASDQRIKNRMTLEDHLELSEKIRNLNKQVNDIQTYLAKKFKLQSKTYNLIGQILQRVTKLKSLLDSEYHNDTTDEIAESFGNIYYNDNKI